MFQPIQQAPAKPPKKRTSCFRNIAIFIIAYMYVGVMGILLRPSLSPPTAHGILLALAFNILFLLFFVSFIRSSTTDPGAVPANWGFYMGDDTKRRRYCKVCNVWKPERTHHCSACNRCVLNMDHHCPWINNCVGFYNRKYFMQLLVYSVISLAYTVAHAIIYLIQESRFDDSATSSAAKGGVGSSSSVDVAVETRRVFSAAAVSSVASSASGFANSTTGSGATTSLASAVTSSSGNVMGFKAICYIYVCVMIFLGLALVFALIPFVQFHFRLVLKNSTTIENLDEASRDSGVYDLGIGQNLQQVFGVNPLCWFAPCNLPLNRPVGDGVRWSQYYYSAVAQEP